MDFIDQIKELSVRISEQLEYVKNEEATKTALIIPFIRTLGYDDSNLREVMPEYTCDAPGKNGEKVDYAIMKGEKPFMLVECKFAHGNLQDKHAAQLHKYFNSIPELKVGVLTNGVIYKFYTDLEHLHIMDKTPFLEIDMLNIENNNLVKELKRFRKDSLFDEEEMKEAAEELDRSKKIKKIWERELDSPSDEFVVFFARQIYPDKKIAKNVKDKVRNSIKKTLKEFIDKKATDEPKPIIDKPGGEGSGGETPPKPGSSGIDTTPEEMKGFNIVREILKEITDPERINYKDWKSYCNVLLDNNSTKPICRFYFNKERKHIGLFDSKGEEKVPIDNLSDICNYADKLKATIDYYGSTDLKTMQLEFWNGFKEYAQSKSTSLRLTHKTHPQHWYTISLGRPKAHIDLSVNTKSNVLTCEIYIPDSKEVFNELVKHTDEIEGELNETLEWLELPNKNASRIKISKSGNIRESDEREEYFEWFKTQADSFQKVFPKYIR